MKAKHLQLNAADLTASLSLASREVWGELAEIYPRLTRFDPPKIVLNTRFWRCAGQAWADDGKNHVELGVKFFLYSQEYYDMMFRVILPHELAHIADFRLFGPSEKSCGHGEKWSEIMVKYGLPADKFHSMELPQSFHIKRTK